jgi:hypothetical protein
MRLIFLGLVCLVAGIFCLSGCRNPSPTPRSTHLEITYGARGIQQLSYAGIVLEDLEQNADDAFHIWHMKSTGLHGEAVSGAQYGWGEVNSARSWDAAKHTWKYFFNWGSISVEFVQAGDSLNINVVEMNNADSGIIFNGATIYPFVLHFPQLPKDFKEIKFAKLASNSSGEETVVADFGRGVVTSSVAGPPKPLYHGFTPVGTGFSYVPVISSTSMDSMPSFFPKIDRPIAPGETDTFTVTLKFAAPGTPAANLR